MKSIGCRALRWDCHAGFARLLRRSERRARNAASHEKAGIGQNGHGGDNAATRPERRASRDEGADACTARLDPNKADDKA